METSTLSSRGYFLWNNTSGFKLGGFEADTAVPVASLTKIMTALITLEHRQLDEKVTITAPMLENLEEFATIDLEVGDVVSVEELLYATLLPSAGDAAQALAISTSGSVAAFAELMNARAEELQMQNTHFSNPVGLDNDNYSTPRDIATLLRAALQNPTFREMFTTFERPLPSLGLTVYKTFSRSAYLQGGKTGFTNAAGRCLASIANVEGNEYILVTVGAEKGQNVADADKVYRFLEANYQPTSLASQNDWLVRLSAPASPDKSLPLLSREDIVLALPNDLSGDELSYDYDGISEITPDLPPNTKLGTFTIRQGDQKLYSQDLYYDNPPEFYNYAFLIIGLSVSLAALVLTVFTFFALSPRPPSRFVRSSRTRRRKFLPLACFLLFLASLAANFLIFHYWFTPAVAPEVNHLTASSSSAATDSSSTDSDPNASSDPDESTSSIPSDPGLASSNCTTSSGILMLINPNFTVDQAFIEARRGQLISVSKTYGIPEYHPEGNGDNLMIPEAAAHLNDMLAAYRAEFPGHEMGTYSCFRARGTSCGRLCAATGTSDHHTGLTCDLIDQQYGTELNTDHYANHREWQWLRANSYKYGFIDRFPEAWAGGSMSEPLNVDATGTTGLFETWHYRYVGITAATEIATGKYNNGAYDSLEHYLKSTGRVADLKAATCP